MRNRGRPKKTTEPEKPAKKRSKKPEKLPLTGKAV